MLTVCSATWDGVSLFSESFLPCVSSHPHPAIRAQWEDGPYVSRNASPDRLSMDLEGSDGSQVDLALVGFSYLFSSMRFHMKMLKVDSTDPYSLRLLNFNY